MAAACAWLGCISSSLEILKCVSAILRRGGELIEGLESLENRKEELECQFDRNYKQHFTQAASKRAEECRAEVNKIHGSIKARPTRPSNQTRPTPAAANSNSTPGAITLTTTTTTTFSSVQATNPSSTGVTAAVQPGNVVPPRPSTPRRAACTPCIPVLMLPSKTKYKACVVWYGIRWGGQVTRQIHNLEQAIKSLEDATKCTPDKVTHFFVAGPSTVRPEVLVSGLHRADIALKFIEGKYKQLQPASSSTSTTSQLRSQVVGVCIVGIVGQGGIGKTRLMDHIIRQADIQNIFTSKAEIELPGENPDERVLMEKQCDLLSQLLDGREIFQRVQTRQRAKDKLKATLEELASTQKVVCITIDNVWNSDHLIFMLPAMIASIRSLACCIMFTTRVRNVVGRLQAYLGVSDANTFVFEPGLLSADDSCELLLSQASSTFTASPASGASASAAQPHATASQDLRTLVEDIFPLCHGLPQALVSVGQVLGYCRNRFDMKNWTEGMASGRPGVHHYCKLDHIFDLSYKQLDDTSKRALLQVASYLWPGWCRHTVGNVVTLEAIHQMEDYSLIASSDLENMEPELEMHVLLRKLAWRKWKELNHKDNQIELWDVEPHEDRKWSVSHLSQSTELGFLRLDVTRAREYSAQTEYLDFRGCQIQMTSKLLFLEIFGPFTCNGSFLELPASVRLFRLKANGSHYLGEALSKTIMPSNLQQLELEECTNLVELPNCIYSCVNLRYLRLVGLPRLQGFQNVSNWKRLCKLWLEKCPNISQLPGDIVELKQLTLIKCMALKGLPEWFLAMKPKAYNYKIEECMDGLEDHIIAHPTTDPVIQDESIPQSELASTSSPIVPAASVRINYVEEVNCLQAIKTLEGTIESLTIQDCPYITDSRASWSLIGALGRLRTLKLKDCCWTSLDGLFEAHKQNAGGDVPARHSMKELSVEYCYPLRCLPRGICTLTSLVELKLTHCQELQALPSDIGSLQALRRLQVCHCMKLRMLPDTITNLVSLEELNLNFCSGLEALPEPREMSKLTNLRKLRLNECSKLMLEVHLFHLSVCAVAHQLKKLEIIGLHSDLNQMPEEIRRLAADGLIWQ